MHIKEAKAFLSSHSCLFRRKCCQCSGGVWHRLSSLVARLRNTPHSFLHMFVWGFKSTSYTRSTSGLLTDTIVPILFMDLVSHDYLSAMTINNTSHFHCSSRQKPSAGWTKPENCWKTLPARIRVSPNKRQNLHILVGSQLSMCHDISWSLVRSCEMKKKPSNLKELIRLMACFCYVGYCIHRWSVDEGLVEQTMSCSRVLLRVYPTSTITFRSSKLPFVMFFMPITLSLVAPEIGCPASEDKIVITWTQFWEAVGCRHDMMTSSNGNIFRVTGHLCGEFTGPRWIPHTKASDAELWCLLWSAPE